MPQTSSRKLKTCLNRQYALEVTITDFIVYWRWLSYRPAISSRPGKIFSKQHLKQPLLQIERNTATSTILSRRSAKNTSPFRTLLFVTIQTKASFGSVVRTHTGILLSVTSAKQTLAVSPYSFLPSKTRKVIASNRLALHRLNYFQH